MTVDHERHATRRKDPCADANAIDDTPEDRSTLIKRILSVKLFDDPNGGAWKRNIKDIEGEILCGTFIHMVLPRNVKRLVQITRLRVWRAGGQGDTDM